MKKLSVIIFMVAVLAGWLILRVQAADEITIHSYRTSNYLTKRTEDVNFVISQDKYDALPEFDPQSSKVPLSIDAALQKAWESIGDKKASVHLQDVRLMNTYEYFPKKKAIWYYIVTFRDNNFGPTQLDALILLDGTVVKPRVSFTSQSSVPSATSE